MVKLQRVDVWKHKGSPIMAPSWCISSGVLRRRPRETHNLPRGPPEAYVSSGAGFRRLRGVQAAVSLPKAHGFPVSFGEGDGRLEPPQINEIQTRSLKKLREDPGVVTLNSISQQAVFQFVGFSCGFRSNMARDPPRLVPLETYCKKHPTSAP